MKEYSIPHIGWAAAVVVILWANTTFAQGSATASASSSARMITGLSVGILTDMSFSGIVLSGSTLPQTVTVEPANLYLPLPSAGLTFFFDGTLFQGAALRVTGNPSTVFAVDGIAPIAISNGTASMVVDSWKIRYNSNPPALNALTQTTGTLDGTGHQTIHIGATLHIVNSPTPQASGHYTGSFPVTIHYQ